VGKNPEECNGGKDGSHIIQKTRSAGEGEGLKDIKVLRAVKLDKKVTIQQRAASWPPRKNSGRGEVVY